MTKQICATLNLPLLEDALAAQEDNTGDLDENSVDNDDFSKVLDAASGKNLMIEDSDHSKKMDEIYSETLQHAKNIADLGYNSDLGRASRMWEVSGQMYRAALDAANSKRDAQLKAMKLKLDYDKLELEKRQAGELPNTIEATGTIVREDRNELIKRLRQQAMEEKNSTS